MSEKPKYPYSYRAYGLNILSQIPLTGFEPFFVKKADVYIHFGFVPEKLNHIINQGKQYKRMKVNSC